MGPLSDIFSSDDNSSENSSEGTADLSSAIGLDANSSSESWSQDEDGNQSYDSSDNSLGLDTSTDGLLSGVTDGMSSSDDTEVGGN
jgi:hypothetical protein